MSTWSGGKSGAESRQQAMRAQLAQRQTARTVQASPPPPWTPPPVTRRTGVVLSTNEGPPPTANVRQAEGDLVGVRVIGALPAEGSTVSIYWAGGEPQIISGAGGGESFGRRQAARGYRASFFAFTTPPFSKEVPFDSEAWDFNNNMSISSSIGRYTAPQDGWYEVFASCALDDPEDENGFPVEFSANFNIESPGAFVYLHSTHVWRMNPAEMGSYSPYVMLASGRIELEAGNQIRMMFYGSADSGVRFPIIGSVQQPTFLDVALAWV